MHRSTVATIMKQRELYEQPPSCRDDDVYPTNRDKQAGNNGSLPRDGILQWAKRQTLVHHKQESQSIIGWYLQYKRSLHIDKAHNLPDDLIDLKLVSM